MERFGNVLGSGLVLLVCVVAWLLGRKANASVRAFRDEHHENFVGRRKA